jgi:hypothetical protein
MINIDISHERACLLIEILDSICNKGRINKLEEYQVLALEDLIAALDSKNDLIFNDNYDDIINEEINHLKNIINSN